MPRWLLCCLLVCCVVLPSEAAIYRCQVDGRPLFSDRPCGAGATRLPIDDTPSYPSAGAQGLRPGEKAWLKRARAADAATRKRRDAAFDREVKAENALKAKCARLRQRISEYATSRNGWHTADGLQARFNALNCGAH